MVDMYNVNQWKSFLQRPPACAWFGSGALAYASMSAQILRAQASA